MGQLEKYGLYVLCLLIFLILGVTFMGSGEVAAKRRGDDPATGQGRIGDGDLNAKVDPERSGGGAQGGGGQGSGGLLSILEPNPIPVKGKKDGPKLGAGGGGSQVPEPPKVEPEPPAPPKDGARPKYKIRNGDSFERIAKKLYGRGSLRTELMRLNPRVDPRHMKIDNDIDLLTPAEVDNFLGKKTLTDQPGPLAPAGVRIYKIKSGDTFGHIASRELGTVKRVGEIEALNPGVDSTNLQVDQPLKLPLK